MRILFVSLLMLAFSFNATARVSDRVSTGKSKANVTFSSFKKALKGFSVVGYWSLAERLPIKTSDGSIDASSERSFGLGLEYKASLRSPQQNLPLSFVGGLAYEAPRELKKITDDEGVREINGAKPSFSLFNVYANLSYAVNKQVALFGGLNFAVPSESDFGEVNLSSGLGYQTGLSAKINQQFGADVVYRWINLNANNDLQRVDVDGLMLQGRYIF